MHFDRYSRLRVAGANVDTIASRIASWAIPELPRERRDFVGMPRTWTAQQLFEDADLVGEAGCRAQSRWLAERKGFLFRLVHHDTDDARVFWHSLFRLTEVGEGGTLVESAVGRSAPPEVHLLPRAYPPSVVRDLLGEPGDIRIAERALTLPTLVLKTPADVAATVDDLLLRPARDTPVVVVAADVGDPPRALVNVETIARKLKGLSVLVVLDGGQVSAAFRETLVDRGLGREMACFQGAIHTYGSEPAMRQDHRLWLGRSLAELPLEERSERVGETLARRLALSQLPHGFFSLIEDHDHAQRQVRAKVSTAPASAKGNMVPAADLAAAEQLMEGANKRVLELEDELSDLRKARDELETAKQQAELDLDVEEAQRAHLQSLLDEHKRNDLAAALPADVRAVLAKVVCDQTPAPKESLEIIEAIFGDRVVVLPEAYESADESRAYRNPRDVFRLLVRLATDFWTKLVNEPGEARGVFSHAEYASGGSETERNNDACIKDRTRSYRGKELVMWPHLKAGGKGGPDRCLRIHFEWVADEQKIVIGHCGHHLKEV